MKTLIAILIFALAGCNTHHKTTQSTNQKQDTFLPAGVTGPRILVYKTKANYNNLVPVILSDDKSKIVTYPHPKDIQTSSGFQVPIVLIDGYLLDVRGIGKNVAFLKLSYTDYSKLLNPPSLEDLYNMIIDKDPLTELYDCGVKNNTDNLVKQLNKQIKKKELSTTWSKLK
jgi:hypothetical protein